MENQKKLNSTNKLIANFYCNKYTNYVGTNIRYKWQFDIIDSKYKNVWYGEKNLKFNTSWNWLMPVIDKIESFTDDLNQCRYNVEIEQCFVCIIDNHNSEDIIELDADKKIDAVYQAVVEFIKFYNKNK